MHTTLNTGGAIRGQLVQVELEELAGDVEPEEPVALLLAPRAISAMVVPSEFDTFS